MQDNALLNWINNIIFSLKIIIIKNIYIYKKLRNKTTTKSKNTHTDTCTTNPPKTHNNNNKTPPTTTKTTITRQQQQKTQKATTKQTKQKQPCCDGYWSQTKSTQDRHLYHWVTAVPGLR